MLGHLSELCHLSGTFVPLFWGFGQKAGTLFTYSAMHFPGRHSWFEPRGWKPERKKQFHSHPPGPHLLSMKKLPSSSSEFYMITCSCSSPPHHARDLSYSSDINERTSPGAPSVHLEAYLGFSMPWIQTSRHNRGQDGKLRATSLLFWFW